MSRAAGSHGGSGAGESSNGGASRDRGQSEVLGVVLLLGITILGVTSVVALGGSAIDDSQHAVRVSSTTDSMTQFDSKASRVALGWSNSQRVDLGAVRDGERVYATDDAGWMNISVNDRETGAAKQVVMNQSLGALVYEVGDTTIAYQGGGVWQKSGNGSVMVSPPEAHYQGTTLTLPLVTVNSSSSLDSTVIVRDDGTSANAVDNLENPIRSGTVSITVHSDYYQAWGRFFEERTETSVAYDHAHNTVTVTLAVPMDTGVDYAFMIQGNAGFGGGASVSSYNSTSTPGAGSVGVGNYEETSSGDVYVTGDTSSSGSGTVNGDIFVKGNYTIDGESDVQGTIYATGDVDIGVTNFDGDVVAGGDVTATSYLSQSEGSTIRAGGNFSMGGGELAGTVHTGGDFRASNGWSVLEDTGSIEATGTVSGLDRRHGTVNEGASPPNLRALDRTTTLRQSPKDRVEQAVATYMDESDPAPGLSGGENARETLTSGSYYHDGDLSYSGDPSLTINSTTGPTTLAVDGDFSIEGDADMTLNTTGGPIRLIVNGSFTTSSTDVDVTCKPGSCHKVSVYANGTGTVGSGGSVTNDAGRGDLFWLYTAADNAGTTIKGSSYYGVVYSQSSVDLGGGTNVYGAVLTSQAGINGGQQIYFDEALLEANTFPEYASLPEVTYLHVSTNPVNVTSSN